MKRSLLAIAFILCSFAGEAGELRSPVVAGGGNPGYTTGIGLRGGISSGLTVKHFIRENRAIEGILSFSYYQGAWITGLYELHTPAFGTVGLNWYYGGGGHIGFMSSSNPIGLDGILGLEYRIQEIPFTIGADLRPIINLNYADHPLLLDVALSVRYIF